LRRPVAKPDLVGSPDQAKVHPNPFSSKLRTSPTKLDDIAFQLTEKMSDFTEEMAAEMRRS